MTGMFASESMERELVRVAKEFLSRLRMGDYDYVWDALVTPKAAKLLSTALLPVNAYKERGLDEVLQPVSGAGFEISFDEVFAFGFQRDIQKVRSQFFTGIARAIDSFGWHQASFEECWTFIDDSSAVLIEPNTPQPLILLFIRQGESYRVDFEAITLFGMTIPASSLYHIGQRALEMALSKSAIAYFELAAAFSHAYSRIKRLMLDNPIVALVVTDERKKELLAEEEYILDFCDHLSSRYRSSTRPGTLPTQKASRNWGVFRRHVRPAR